MFKRILCLALAMAMAFALTGALAAQKVKKLDYEWYALEDGVLTVTLRSEGKAQWRYASESSLGGSVETLSDEITTVAIDDGEAEALVVSFKAGTDGKTMLTFNLESGKKKKVKMIAMLGVTIEDGVIVAAEASEMNQSVIDAAQLDPSKLGLPK